MNHWDYLDELADGISGLKGEYQLLKFNDIRQKDGWFPTKTIGRGWGIVVDNGTILIIYDDLNKGKLYLVEEIQARKDEELPEDVDDIKKFIGTFKSPPSFNLQLISHA